MVSMNTGLFVLGFVLLIVSVFAYGYTVENNQSYLFGVYKTTSSVQPYQSWTVPFVVLGLLGIILDLVMSEVRTVTCEKVVVYDHLAPRGRH